MPPARNDPCPCGSGKKYKHCCLRKDEQVSSPLRLVRQASGGAHGFDLRDRDVSDRWEVDIVPTPIGLGDTPDARPVLAIVAAGDLVLARDLIARPPVEQNEMAAIMVDMIERARTATDRDPATIVVRYDVFAAPLAAALRSSSIEVSAELPAIDSAFNDLASRTLGVPMEELLDARAARVSRPELWAGWGHPPEIIAALFRAAADYYRAAPWRVLGDADVLVAKFADG